MPVQFCDVVLSMLIGVGGPIIGIQLEVGVRAGINANPLYCLLFVRTLHRCTQWKDRARSHEDRNRVDRSGHNHSLSAMKALASPEIEPVASCRKVDRSACGSLIRYWSDQQGGSEHVFISHVSNLRVVGEVHEQ